MSIRRADDTRTSGKPPTVFICHSSNDTTSILRELVPFLQESGVGVRGDFSFPSGIHRDENIREAIEASDFLLAVVSPYWRLSDYSQGEWEQGAQLERSGRAGFRRAVKIAPLSGADKEQFEESYIDLTNPETRLAGLDQLRRELGGYEPRLPTEPKIPSIASAYPGLSAPMAALVYSLDDVIGSTAPFDLGTAFGLARHAFVVVIVGGPLDAQETLARTEIALFDAQHPFLRVPVRYWAPLRVADHANGPATAEEVWMSAELMPAVKQYLRAGDWDPGVIAGFVLRVTRTDSGTLASARLWCRKLFQLFGGKAAVVIHLEATPGAVAIAAASQLAASIRHDQPPGPVECLLATGGEIPTEPLSLRQLTDAVVDHRVRGIDWGRFDPDDLMKSAPNGLTVDDWVLGLLRVLAAEPDHAACVAAVNELKLAVAGPVRRTVERALAKGPANPTPDADPSEWLLAARAGLGPRMDVPAAIDGALESLGAWWWLSTMTPTIDFLARILHREVSERMVLGLVTDRERRAAVADATFVAVTEERRRRRRVE